MLARGEHEDVTAFVSPGRFSGNLVAYTGDIPIR